MPGEQGDAEGKSDGVGPGGDQPSPFSILTGVRAAAHKSAAAALDQPGFTKSDDPRDEYWATVLALPRSGAAVPVKIRLPREFPDALPRIAVSESDLPKRIAHVDVGGNLCLIPTSNVLLDADRPKKLVADALVLATDLLDRGMLGESDADLDAEFQAFWVPTDPTTVLSICAAAGLAREIIIGRITGSSKLIDKSYLIGDSTADIEAWAANLGTKCEPHGAGLFVPVVSSIPMRQVLSVSMIAQLIKEGGEVGLQLFRDAIERAAYPQLIVLSMPEVPKGAGPRLAAVRLLRPDSTLLARAAHGFRPGHVPAERVLKMIGEAAVDCLNLKRVDRAYLTARGGVAYALSQATIAIVGVGAVGSEVARNLAALGVGHIRLIDAETMEPENVHRHALGMNSTGWPKVSALTVELRASFPHLAIDFQIQRAETLLEKDPEYLLESDLIVLATGEETLERRLNRVLQGCPPRVHTWLEPLGIGGHSFACDGRTSRNEPPETRGCFECLYRPDDTFGLVNRTALTAPGQEIRKSLAGCAGTFSPFSPLDARRTAADAAELVARVLTRAGPSSVLVSWRGLHTDFEAAGYRLSERARQMPPGSRVEVSGTELWRVDCFVCGTRPPRSTATDLVDADAETPS